MNARLERVRAVVEELSGEPFEWGVNDCCQFARRVVTAVRGEDPAPHLVYRDEAGAKAILDEHGGLEPLVSDLLGAPALATTRLVPGDLCLVRVPEPALGVVAGDGALCVARNRVVRVPASRIMRGWSI